MVDPETSSATRAVSSDAGVQPSTTGHLPFARGYPGDPELQRLLRAFEHGDYRTVRDEAPALAQRTTDVAVRDAALDLRRRIEPDRLQVQLLVVTFALLAFLTTWFYLHKH